jgi:uncharacterized membrane protein YphA (DoxX/SURF4 family)
MARTRILGCSFGKESLMPHGITEVGYGLLTLTGYLVIFSVVPAVLTLIISKYLVSRDGNPNGLVAWNKRIINTYGFDDDVHTLKILGLSLVTLILCIPAPSDPISALSTFLSNVTFLITAGSVAKRRRLNP